MATYEELVAARNAKKPKQPSYDELVAARKAKSAPKKTEQEPVKKEATKPPTVAAPLPSSISTPKMDLGFGSSNSTMMIPTTGQVQAVESVVDPVVAAGKTIAAKAKEMRASKSTGTRVIGALADSVINIGKDMVKKLDTAARNPTAPALLDYGINGATLGLADFIPEAAPELIGAAAEGVAKRIPVVGSVINSKKVGETVQRGVQKGMEAIFGHLLHDAVGGVGVKAWEKVFGEATPEEQEQIRSATTAGVMIAGFKTVGKISDIRDTRIQDMRDATGMVGPMAESLGIDLGKVPPPKDPPPGVRGNKLAGTIDDGIFYVDSINDKTRAPDGSKYKVVIRTSKTGKRIVEKYTVSESGEEMFVEASSLADAQKKYSTDNADTLANRVVNPFVDYDFQLEKYTPTKNVAANPSTQKTRVPSVEEIKQAYKDSLYKAASEGGPHMTMKMDAFDTAYQMLLDHKNMPLDKFNAKWQPIFEQGSVLADRINSSVETKMDDAMVTKDAENVNKVFTEPATKESYREARNLSDREKLAFEQELVDMNVQNDVDLGKAADENGYKYSRTQDPFDRRPAHYDTQTGEIVLNESTIRDTLLEVWNDKVIRVGEGKLTTIFRKIKNETFQAMKTRYEQTLLKHEIAHAKTVTPEDAARLRAAIATGDKKAEARLRADLEEKASQYTIEQGNNLTEDMNTAVDRGVQEYQTYQETRSQLDAMKYEKTEMEASYDRWKRIVKNNPDYRNADFDQLEGALKKRPAYQEQGAVKKLFEDALAKQDEIGPDSFDALLSEFQKRRSAEERILGEYKKTRDAQATLALKPSEKDAATREFIRREIKAETAKQKLLGENRTLEMGKLRERISRRLEKKVMNDRFAEVEKKLKGEKVNVAERAQTKISKLEGKVFKERVAGRMERDVLREKMEGQKQELRTKIQTKREAQQLIVDFMRQNRVPKEVRVQAITGLKNAKNPADVLAVVQEMRKNWNEFDRKQNIRDIRDMFKENSPEINKSGLKVGKMTAEAQRELNRIEEVSKRSRNELNQQIVMLVDEFRSKNPDTIELPPEIAAKMNILELGGLKEQTLQQLEATRDYIENLVERGKSERTAQLEMEKAKNQELVEGAREYINGSKAEVTRSGILKQDTLVARAKEGIKAFWRSGSILPELAIKFGKGVENLVDESISAKNRGKKRANTAVQNLKGFILETYGKDAGLINSEMAKQTDFGDFKDGNGGTTRLVLKKSESLDLYMKLQDSRAREVVTKNNGYTPEMINKALSTLSDADKKLGDYLIEKGYSQHHGDLANIYEYTRGVPYGKVDRYSGHLRYEGDPELNTFLDQALMDVSNRKRVGSPEFEKSRTDGVRRKLRLSSDPIGDFVNYAEKVGHYIEMSENAPRLNALLTDKTLKDSIIEKYGESAWSSFKYHVNNLLRGEIENIEVNAAVRGANALTGNVSGVLVRRPSVVAGQYSSLAQFRSVAKRGSAFWRGVAKAKEMQGMLDKYAPGVRLRAEGSAAKIMHDITGERTSYGRGLKKFQDVTGRPLEKADGWTTLRGAAGLFNDRVEFYQKKGMSLEESRVKAGKDVDKFIIETQSTSDISGKSELELQPSILQAFTNLRNQPNKVIHGNKVAFERFRKGEMTSKEYANYLYWNNIVQPVAYVTLRHGAKAATTAATVLALHAAGQGEAADERWKKFKEESLGKEVIGGILNTSLTGSFIVGDIAEMIVNNAIFGKNYEVRPGVLQALTDDLNMAAKQWAAGDVDETGIIAARAVSRGVGIPDPMDLIGMFLSVVSRGNTEAKAEARKTPEAKFEAAQKRRAEKLKKALGK